MQIGGNMNYELKDLRLQRDALNPQKMLENLESDFDIKPSVGIWYFTPGGGRFHDRYLPQATITQRIEMAADMAELGVKGIEAHYPDEINEENLHLYQQLEEKTGIRVVGIPFSHFFDKIFEFGSLSNHIKKSRDEAIKIAVGGLKIVKAVGADCAISWPGMDGYRYIFDKPYMLMWDVFESAMAEAMDEVPGVRVAIEPKGYEPAANNIYRTTAEAILAAQRIEQKLTNDINKKLLREGHTLVGVNPEIGHVKMTYEILPAAFSLIMMERRLAHTHLNSQPDGNYDQDNNIGVVNMPETEALIAALWAYGYKGYCGIDINPENMPVKTAIEINIIALNKIKERIVQYPHEKLISCHLQPDINRGNYEKIMIQNW